MDRANYGLQDGYESDHNHCDHHGFGSFDYGCHLQQVQVSDGVCFAGVLASLILACMKEYLGECIMLIRLDNV